ncbi:DUF6221 family protein [Trujillonella endophytica]|uniref:Uncharacterized protein n=1 Tax=Trujillonella endophytica TaxID=673521 RepID=A0A1H8Q0C0_9ACTN|nr:DUF6221 family protein [Trujillella endophytica]SEO47377.1 hypothetical protein SAMN05660991_00481 [Trujillella endophytica]
MSAMETGSGLEPDMQPRLDEFLLARIAEDKRVAAQAGDRWPAGGLGERVPAGVREHVARHDPQAVLADCAARWRLVLACRDLRPEVAFVGSRQTGMADFPVPPADAHQLAALTLALLALPYADHPDYRQEWRP